VTENVNLNHVVRGYPLGSGCAKKNEKIHKKISGDSKKVSGKVGRLSGKNNDHILDLGPPNFFFSKRRAPHPQEISIT